MKLTRQHKDSFVRAVMADVPTVDYVQQATDLLLQKAAAKLPAAVRAVWNDPTLRGFIKCDRCVHTPFGLPYIYVPPFDGELCAGTKVELIRLGEANDDQKDARRDLEHRVYSIIASCSTLKQAKERLPEFVKYLPSETSVTPNAPATSNVVADLVKAGWEPT